jgi:hypothetical protein
MGLIWRQVPTSFPTSLATLMPTPTRLLAEIPDSLPTPSAQVVMVAGALVVPATPIPTPATRTPGPRSDGLPGRCSSGVVAPRTLPPGWVSGSGRRAFALD